MRALSLLAAAACFRHLQQHIGRCEVPLLCWGWAEVEARAQGTRGLIFTANHHNNIALLNVIAVVALG